MARVTFGRLYTYHGVLFDQTDGHPKPREGQIVRVTRLPMAPKENVMGMCYVADPKTGDFLGMVMTNSLTAVRS
jgi:hypothetical protein